MAFTAVEFYHLACELREAANGDDAKLRSAISRAYYAAFLVARDKANISSRGADGHSRVIKHYSQIPTDAVVANWLNDLKMDRQAADYDLSQVCTGRIGGKSVGTARKVLEHLKALEPIPDPTALATNPKLLH
jgi:uncharacterized protein (UPF0332 family)